MRVTDSAESSTTRVFFDSGVLMRALRADWGAAKAVFILGTYRIFALETSEVVMREVTGALERAKTPTGPGSDFAKLCATAHIVVHPCPSKSEIEEGLLKYLPLMRHAPDVAVLVSACKACPDWLVSSNSAHFTPAVARASGLRIVTPSELMRYLNIHKVPQRT